MNWVTCPRACAMCVPTCLPSELSVKEFPHTPDFSEGTRVPLPVTGTTPDPLDPSNPQESEPGGDRSPLK